MALRRAKSTIEKSSMEDIVKKHGKTITRLDIDGELHDVISKNRSFLHDLAEHTSRVNKMDLQRAIAKYYGELPMNEVKRYSAEMSEVFSQVRLRFRKATTGVRMEKEIARLGRLLGYDKCNPSPSPSPSPPPVDTDGQKRRRLIKDAYGFSPPPRVRNSREADTMEIFSSQEIVSQDMPAAAAAASPSAPASSHGHPTQERY